MDSDFESLKASLYFFHFLVLSSLRATNCETVEWGYIQTRCLWSKIQLFFFPFLCLVVLLLIQSFSLMILVYDPYVYHMCFVGLHGCAIVGIFVVDDVWEHRTSILMIGIIEVLAF